MAVAVALVAIAAGAEAVVLPLQVLLGREFKFSDTAAIELDCFARSAQELRDMPEGAELAVSASREICKAVVDGDEAAFLSACKNLKNADLGAEEQTEYKESYSRYTGYYQGVERFDFVAYARVSDNSMVWFRGDNAKEEPKKLNFFLHFAHHANAELRLMKSHESFRHRPLVLAGLQAVVDSSVSSIRSDNLARVAMTAPEHHCGLKLATTVLAADDPLAVAACSRLQLYEEIYPKIAHGIYEGNQADLERLLSTCREDERQRLRDEFDENSVSGAIVPWIKMRFRDIAEIEELNFLHVAPYLLVVGKTSIGQIKQVAFDVRASEPQLVGLSTSTGLDTIVEDEKLMKRLATALPRP